LSAGLRDRCETLLVTGTVPPGEDDMGYFAAQNGIEPMVIPEMSREISPKDALTIWKLYRLLLREKPDIVHTHTAKAGTAGRVAGFLYRWIAPGTLIGRPRRCRFIHTYHGHVFHSYYGSLKTRLFLSIEKTLARMTDRIIVISPQQLFEINEKFGVGKAEQFSVVPLGLDVALFSDWRGRRKQLRDELKASKGDLLVGIVGRLTEVKNHRLFLEVAARFHKEEGIGKGSVRFLVIGDGHLRQELEAHARALGIADKVHFLGTLNDPEIFYPALDVVALTSLNEGTPLSLIEAMANARPCIATAVGGVVDLLGSATKSNGYAIAERGILVESGDTEGFSQGLMRLLEDERLRDDFGARGLEFIRLNYSKERLLEDISGIYAELVDATLLNAKQISSVQSEAEDGKIAV
jgi:glycosyltransferase involved in cell wall biosynthesis